VGKAYTYSTWIVKPGMEEEFIRRWHDWAAYAHSRGLERRAKLLRDVDSSNRFVSFGPWESMSAVRRWRADEGFHERTTRLQEVIESFQPHTLEEIAEG
jgi:heme-degrading monooxygenase HmoA